MDKLLKEMEETAEIMKNACKTLLITLKTINGKRTEVPVGEYNSINSTTFSVFYAPITNTSKKKDIKLIDLYELIKGESFKERTQELRKITEPKSKNSFKCKHFCYATCSGTFSSRSEKGLILHSGLICIDLDDLDDDLQRVKEIINSDSETVMSFISPSGNGLKIIYYIDPTEGNQGLYYEAISEYISILCNLPEKLIDKSCKDISRACFICHDPNVYLKPEILSLKTK